MEGVEHLGKYVHQMTQAKREALVNGGAAVALVGGAGGGDVVMANGVSQGLLEGGAVGDVADENDADVDGEENAVLPDA